MAKRTNADKGKDSLELLGVKVDPALKAAIETEADALGIAMSTYARQLLITGWRSRHEAPVAKNPRELILTELFNNLPLSEQENVITMVEALHKKHAKGALSPISRVVERNPTLNDRKIETEGLDHSDIARLLSQKKGVK